MGCVSEEVLLQFLGGGLSPEAVAAVVLHLSACDPCRELLAAVAEGEPAASASAPPGPPGSDGAERYQLLRTVGAGGMGIIYAARDRQLDRVVALKMLRSVQPGDRLEALKGGILREARAMARLAHPNVVAVHDVGLLEGGSLSGWLRQAPRSWGEVLEVFRAAGRGLAAAHAAGIVHRDFKPDNVLIGKDGRVRVTDFGLARLAASAGTVPPGPAAGRVGGRAGR